MLNFKIRGGKVLAVAAELPADSDFREWQCRCDWRTIEEAVEVAKAATEATCRLHVGTDAGPHVHPRYDVVAAPVVGAPVSRSFNGDSYPAGKIAKVSESLRRVETDDGTVFYRRGITAMWISNGTWHMVAGHINERNPHF